MIEPARNAPKWSAVALLLLVSLIAVSLFFSPGTGDVSIWVDWIREISSYGLIGGFKHSGTDYPPLAFVLLAAVSRGAATFGIAQFLALKFSLLIFLLATAACFYWFTRNLILTAALELALMLNSMGLAYLDIYFAPFVLVYVLDLARERAPENHRIKTQMLPFLLAAGAVALPLLVIFGWKVFDSLERAMTRHAFLSAYALNLSWLETWALHLIQPDKYEPLQNGMIDIFLTREPIVVWPDKILFYLSYLAILVAFARQPKTFARLLVYSILGYMAYFVLNTGVHENHLFLVCCLGWMLVFFEADQLTRCINLSIAANANLFLFYGVVGQRLNPVIAGVDITLFFALANICLFAGLLLDTLKRDGADLWFFRIAPRQTTTA